MQCDGGIKDAVYNGMWVRGMTDAVYNGMGMKEMKDAVRWGDKGCSAMACKGSKIVHSYDSFC